MTSHSPVPIQCSEFDALLAGYLEDALDGGARQNADAHLVACARCTALLADLVELREEAARLPVLKPTRDLWDGIAGRIETPAINLGERRPAWRAQMRLVAAAVVLVATTAAITWRVARINTPVVTASADTMAPGAGVALASNKVAEVYDARIAELREILDRKSGSLDSATLRVIAINLRVIDEAIERVRGALDSMPSNTLLTEKLERAYEMKLNTMRQFAELSSE
jgi:hypothetical protein